jgi:lipopolysaccharide transport system ATP-binding protein
MSTTHAIQAEGVGKRYRIWSGVMQHDHLRTMLAERARAILTGKRRRRVASEYWALQDVHFQIRHGENVGIIGLNGAGKSTLLKIMSRIVEPTTGSVRIDGRVGALLEVGTGFAPELTGRENIFLYGSILGMTRSEVARKFDAIIDFSGIERHLDTPVKRYSSGMYVRLGFAVAAHLDPEILFLDEVLAVGDLSFQRKCFEFTKGLQRREATILFVSHSMFNIKTMCDRVIYLKGGRIEYDGPVEAGIEVYERDCRLAVVSWEGAGEPEDWPIYIDRCELLGREGNAKTVFDHAERMTVRVFYRSRRPLAEPNVMVSLVRSDGIVCCTYSTEADGVDLGTIETDGMLELDIPSCTLTAQMYSMRIEVRRKGYQDIVCAQIGTTFHIRDELLDTHFGVFHEPGVWRGDAVQGAALLALERPPEAVRLR